jgi:hypothetical protein
MFGIKKLFSAQYLIVLNFRPGFSDGPLPSVMQEVDLPVINNTACERMYRDAGYVEHIPSIFICAGYAAGGKDSCEVIVVIKKIGGAFQLETDNL